MNTPIMGQSLVTVEQCENFLRKQNFSAPYLARSYKKYCDIYGIRLECVWVQMCLETNFLRYSDTSITTLDMHNYAGLGALDNNGRRQALSFNTEDEGIKCHVQHLYAYCSSNPLPANEKLIDPRFKYVTRGIAPNIENLGNGNWASDKDYANKLLNLLNQLLSSSNVIITQKLGGNIMSKFAVDPGHGVYPDTGAEGYLNEQNCALDIAIKVISKLQSLGHTAYNVRPSSASSVTNSLQQRCDNAVNADYLISIHLNAGGGKGSEVFAMSADGNTLASGVLKSLTALGFINRGVKDGSGLYVIKNSKPVAILIEVCFVDTQSDVDLYNKLGDEVIATAIVQGLTGQTVKPNNSSPDFIKSVQHDLQRVSCLESGEINATGVLDAKTKAAIKQLRYVVDLPSGEQIDDNLINALNTITKKPTIGEGWNSPVIAVKFVQWYLGLPKTGVVDSKMTQAMKNWQVRAGIWSASGADGVIRTLDWNKILK